VSNEGSWYNRANAAGVILCVCFSHQWFAQSGRRRDDELVCIVLLGMAGGPVCTPGFGAPQQCGRRTWTCAWRCHRLEGRILSYSWAPEKKIPVQSLDISETRNCLPPDSGFALAVLQHFASPWSADLGTQCIAIVILSTDDQVSGLPSVAKADGRGAGNAQRWPMVLEKIFRHVPPIWRGPGPQGWAARRLGTSISGVGRPGWSNIHEESCGPFGPRPLSSLSGVAASKLRLRQRQCSRFARAARPGFQTSGVVD